MVTARAFRGFVLSGQFKSGCGMIERGIFFHCPRICCMTILTRHAQLAMRRCLRRSADAHPEQQYDNCRLHPSNISVAVITRRCLIHIPRPAVVLGVRLRLRMAVARHATEVRQIPGHRMTLRALCPAATVMTRIDFEPPAVMIHGVRCPHGCAVALGAIMIEQLRHVIRVRHIGVICLMTLIAVRVMQLVIPVHMARLALHRRMRARQRE